MLTKYSHVDAKYNNSNAKLATNFIFDSVSKLFFQTDDKQVKNKRKKQMKGTKQGYRETTIVNNHPRESKKFVSRMLLNDNRVETHTFDGLVFFFL